MTQQPIIGIPELNNLAVICIDANKLKEGINILVQALELTRYLFYHGIGSPSVAQDPAGVGSCSQNTSARASHVAAPRDYQLTSSPPSLTPLWHFGTATTTMSNSNVRCIDFDQKPFHHSLGRKYHKPFWAFQEMDDRYSTSRWSPTNGTLTSESEHQTTLRIGLSAIVIFNCALCHDLLASSMVSSSKRKVFHDKAIALYEKVIGLYFESSTHGMMMMMEVDPMARSSSNNNRPQLPGLVGAQQDMIVMAAVNNLVQMHHESSHERKYYSQLLMALFEVIQATDYGSEEIQSQVDSQARVFVSNTILSQTMELTRPAAAA